MSLEGDSYEFSKAELSCENKIYQSIANVSHNQPIEEGASMGTSGLPLRRTRGTMGLGEGSIEWSDLGEMQDFIDQNSSSTEGFCEKEFKLTIVYRAKNRPTLKHTLFQCRLLDAEFDIAQGADASGGTLPFSFMSREINGKKAIVE